MLDTETKRRIDTARDILVGKVPDPKSQVEQITIALIYKFMDDMDAESEELGGKRKFFTGKFAQYGWPKLMHSGLGGHEVLSLYAEAINKMPENPGIPPLFREIFKNAYLPYRDPETLKSFLKTIDGFTYDHSERLGDAFEYLLSVLGSQGDAGQFRTPRHIIDFIVSIVDPKKGEVILDPACGTAGFLISAYKHILKVSKDEKKQLTPDERLRLAKNLKGYDISPDMVRLSLVNLYLHNLPAPNILEYDTLTSEEHWNKYADVILANPPFMSPKGGIRPHKRFSIDAKRSEVLFVDYIAEHLTPTGRAGIIVPEGIIFQSGTAYKQLRKNLVDTSLVAVISLPAGVFNPYSGVKTSILILDKALAKQSSTIGFFKIESDGFGLGAQRRAIEKDDIPQVSAELKSYLNSLRGEQPLEAATTTALIVPKSKIAANGDYNLSGDRYREGTARTHSFPFVLLGDPMLFHVESGGTPKSDQDEYWNGDISWATLVDLPATDFISEIRSTKRRISEQGLRESSAKIIPANSVIVSTRATIGRIAINRIPIATNQGFKNIIIKDDARAVTDYVALALTKLVPTMQAWATGGTFAEISKSKFCELEIPLPPLEVQQQIVAEIEGYQKVINGARAVLDNYHPHIPINPDWPLRPIGDLTERIQYGLSVPLNKDQSGFKTFRMNELVDGRSIDRGDMKRAAITAAEFEKYRLGHGDILFNRTNSFEHVGRTGVFDLEGDYCFASYLIRMTIQKGQANPFYVNAFMNTEAFQQGIKQFASQAIGQSNINAKSLAAYPIPVPPLATQQAIVAEIEAEQALVAANRELITRFERKIQATLARIWGDGEAGSLRE